MTHVLVKEFLNEYLLCPVEAAKLSNENDVLNQHPICFYGVCVLSQPGPQCLLNFLPF